MKIVLTGGGTAGHCLPNLALVARLNATFTQIDYVGSKTGMERELALAAGLSYHGVETCKLVRSLTPKNLLVPFQLLRGRAECIRLLKKLAPDVVFSKGGYVALPVALACKRLKIPLVCHESDLSFGLANRLCLPFATRVLTAFPQTANGVKNAKFIGTPLRENLFRAKRGEGLCRYGFDGQKPVLLILGGSLGAESLNRAVLQLLDDLLKKFDVLHLVGKKNTLPLPQKKGYVWRNFEPEMEFAYAAASFALSRAGANALFELTALGVPTLAVPLSSGRGDQKENAAYFAERGAVAVLGEEQLHTKSLYDELLSLRKNAPAMRRAMQKLGIKNANAAIVEELTAVAKAHGKSPFPQESKISPQKQKTLPQEKKNSPHPSKNSAQKKAPQ